MLQNVKPRANAGKVSKSKDNDDSDDENDVDIKEAPIVSLKPSKVRTHGKKTTTCSLL